MDHHGPPVFVLGQPPQGAYLHRVQLHLSSDTTNTFVLGVLRECNVMRSPVTSNYVFRFDQQGMNVTKWAVLADLSSTPANFQSFQLILTGGTESPNNGIINLSDGDHTYRVWNASGATTGDIVGDVMASGWATVHGTAPTLTQYTEGDNTPAIAYD